MAFVSGNDVITTVRADSQVYNGSIVVFPPLGQGSGTNENNRENPLVNRYMDSGTLYTRAHRRFFPQFLTTVSGAYDYSNG